LREWYYRLSQQSQQADDMHVGARQALHTQAASIQASTYNKEPTYLAIAATLVSFALLIFLLRVYTRIRLLRFFAIDDWFILGAAVGNFKERRRNKADHDRSV
jgi:lipoprotein signal peptidase